MLSHLASIVHLYATRHDLQGGLRADFAMMADSVERVAHQTDERTS